LAPTELATVSCHFSTGVEGDASGDVGVTLIDRGSDQSVQLTSLSNANCGVAGQ
jgi:hypothetical protein